MKIIITGGTGSIGSALGTSLLGDGHEVVVLSRFPEAHQGLVKKGFRVVGWDARTEAGWHDEVDGADVVLNFAGAPLPGDGFFPKRWTLPRRRTILESRRGAGEAVTAAVRAARRKPRVVVQASAVGYYGPNPAGPITEAAPPGDDFLARVCRAWEDATAPVEAEGVRRVIIRTGIILDARTGALPRLVLPFKLFAGGRMGSGRQWMPWIHPADELGAIRFLMEHDRCAGPFNLTAPYPVTNQEFARTLGRVMHRPSWFPVPPFALRLAFGELATTVLDGQQAMPEGLVESGYQFMYPTLEGALRDVLA